MKNKFKRIIITTGALLMMTMAPITQSNPLGQYMSSMTTITAQAAEQVPTFSEYWYQSEDGAWHIKDGNGNTIKNGWVCDDAVASNGQNIWYLIDANGNMVSHGLVKDQTGNIYSLETNHNGYYGMLRHTSGNYDGVYLDIEQSHDGAFGKIKNADGINALQSKYGLAVVDINNSNCYYTSTFKGGASSGGPGQSVSSPAAQSQAGNDQYAPSNNDNQASQNGYNVLDLDGDGKLSMEEILSDPKVQEQMNNPNDHGGNKYGGLH